MIAMCCSRACSSRRAGTEGKSHGNDRGKELASRFTVQNQVLISKLGGRSVMGGYNILKARVKMDVEALFPQTC